MKLLHTADWQIGMKAESVGLAGERVRAERLAAGRRVVQLAQEKQVDCILVAGDLFEDNAVDRSLIQTVADILAAFGGPVYIIPGNHDPLTPGSVWEHPAWGSADKLHLIREAQPIELDMCILYPCPLFEKYSTKNPTAWIRTDQKEQIHIGLAHGTVEGVQQEEADYPIPRDAAEKLGLDYLALGHWHSTATYPDADGALRMAYSGTHETSKFGERDSGNALMVEIEKPGATPKLTTVHTGGLTWQSLTLEIRTTEDLTRLRAEIEKIEAPESTLLRTKLSGLLHAEAQESLAHIREILESRFLWGAMESSALLPAPDDDQWIATLPPGLIQESATRLMKLATAETAEAKSKEVAARALMELYAIAGELGP